MFFLTAVLLDKVLGTTDWLAVGAWEDNQMIVTEWRRQIDD